MCVASGVSITAYQIPQPLVQPAETTSTGFARFIVGASDISVE
jgi:hypothetical protein